MHAFGSIQCAGHRASPSLRWLPSAGLHAPFVAQVWHEHCAHLALEQHAAPPPAASGSVAKPTTSMTPPKLRIFVEQVRTPR